MAKCIFKRLVAGMLSLFILITTTFFLAHVIPGGPFNPSEQRNVPKEILEQISEKYGLNDPLPTQHIRRLGGLLHGDMGTPLKERDTTVNEPIANGLSVLAEVGALGIAVVLVAGVPLGIVAAVKRGGLAGGASMALATIDASVPSFVFCVLIMYIFCEKRKIFPSYGLTSQKHYMPSVFYIAFSQVAYITRPVRPDMLETMCWDYIWTERSKGVPEWEVIGEYALRNSVPPMVIYVGLLMAVLPTGTFIIGRLFSIPGLGHYFISAIMDRDYSVMLGFTMFLGVIIIDCNLIVDIMYIVIDPKVKITE